MSEPTFTFTVPPPAPVPEQARRRRFSGALWLIGMGLVANAAVMLFHGRAPDIVFDRAALGQATAAPTASPMLGARGIYMMPAQLGPNAYGMFLLDVDSQTICVYRVNTDTSRFHLMASRSYNFDRFREDYNNDSPTPKQVQELVEAQRARTELKDKNGVPTVDQNPKPDENKPDVPPDMAPPEAPK